MPPEPLPFDRKDFFKDRKPSSSDPVGIVPARWRETPTTPSSHQDNHGSSLSYRWGGGGVSSDFRRPFSGHGKQVDGGWHITTVESGPCEDKYCGDDSSKENNINNSRVSVAFSCQKDRLGGNSWETTASPNGNSHPHSDYVNSWDQIQSKDQHAKNNDGVITTGGQRLEKENSLGSSLDWKPLKWMRSGSLSSRGSGFSHSSSSKSIGVDSFDTKIEAQSCNSAPLQSPSGDAAPCVTPRTPDEASSRKKPRLGWGEGLAKYEKKKVGPDDIVDKEVGARNGMVDGVSSSEPLLPSPANLPDKSPSLTGCSECASPATPYSFACSSSPGLQEKASIKATTVDIIDICNPSVPPCHLSQNNTEGSTFNLENLELTEGVNFSSSLNELLQSDDSSTLGSGFVRSTAMDKLQVWKADITRTLEITESEIDSLEYELKSLISDGGSCPLLAAYRSLPSECNDKNAEERSGPLPLRIISSGDMSMEKADGSVEERTEFEGLDEESPGTATSKFVEPLTLCNNVTHSDAVDQRDSPVNLDIRSENTEAQCSQDHVSDDILGVVPSCEDGSEVPAGVSSTVSICGDVQYGREDKLYNLILASNKVLANRASDELSRILPTTQWCTNISRATNESLIMDKFAMRKRFLRFKERVITLKFRAFRYLWKEDLRLLSIRRFGARSQKKFELSSRMGYTDHQKHRSSIHSRFSTPAGSLSLVPTREIVDYANKLLSDTQVRIYRNTLKMPSFILDKRERMNARFISDNGLVENPCDVEKERSIVNPWTLEEKEIFLDKFSLFGKDLRKIASFLEHKTIADCVEFYYKNHKSDRFQKTKKNPEFAKQGKSYSTNTYLVTSGKRLNRETNAASLDMLGAASAMAANVDGGMGRQWKRSSNFYVGTSSDHKLPRGDGRILDRSNSLAMFCNEWETAAADVLAGICGSMSSEVLGSCITTLVDTGDVHHQGRRCKKLGGSSKRLSSSPEASQNDVDEDTCSDDNCGREMDPSDWTDEEKSSFIQAVKSYGKDFSMISGCLRTRSRDQCKVFFSKARKCLGLDAIHLELGSEGTMGANQGGGSDHDDTCMVDSGSVISCDKSSSEIKMDVEDLHSSDSKEELAEFDQNVVTDCREPELVLANLISDGCEAENKPEAELVGEQSSNGNLEEADDNKATNLEEAAQNTYSEGSAIEVIDHPSASGAKLEADTVAKVSAKNSREVIRESEPQLPCGDRCNGNANEVRGLSSCPAEDLNSASHYSRCSSLGLSIDNGNNLELNVAEKVVSQESDNGFLTSNLFPQDPIAIPHRKTLSQDDISSRLSFRKSCDRPSQRSSSTDGYHLHLPKHSLLDCVESPRILRGYPITVSANKGMNGSPSYNELQSNYKMDKSLLLDPCMPSDCSLQMCTSLISDACVSQEQRPSSSSDVEKPNRSGDVKLFGQILTNPSSQQQQPPPKANGSAQESDQSSATHLEKLNGGKSFNLKFDNHSTDRKLASLDLDRSNDHCFGVESNFPSRSYGFWDGNRKQTGFPSFPDSAVLLAKYPAAFGNTSTSSKLEQQQLLSLKSGNEQRNMNVVRGFQTRNLSNNNLGANYPAYRSQEVVTVDKLLPEMSRRKELDVLSSVQQQGRGMVGLNVVGREGGILGGGTCNGVSDPVAAIRMHYAKTEPYKNGVNIGGQGESWRGNGSAI